MENDIIISMRRIFIIRKDLHLSPGKLAAMVGHCCEAYWTNLMKSSGVEDNEFTEYMATNPWDSYSPAWYHNAKLERAAKKAFDRGEKTFLIKKNNPRPTVTVQFEISKDVWDGYVNGIFTKTICEARNLNNLMKAKTIANELGLKENKDYGFINDKCLTELKPENEDGTTTVGMWFAPLANDTAHQISKKFPLYRDP